MHVYIFAKPLYIFPKPQQHVHKVLYAYLLNKNEDPVVFTNYN